MGVDLEPLGFRELQYLEQQIDTSLKRLRNRKVKIQCNALNIFMPSYSVEHKPYIF